MPGVEAPRLATIALATIVLAGLNLLIRPLLLALFNAISVIALVIATLVFQAVAFLLIARFVPEFQVSGLLTSLIASFVYAAILTILASVFNVDRGDSYWATLVQQLSARSSDAIHSEAPGVVIIQIDGLAHPILAAPGPRRARAVHLAAGCASARCGSTSGWRCSPRRHRRARPGSCTATTLHPGVPVVGEGPPGDAGLEPP